MENVIYGGALVCLICRTLVSLVYRTLFW